MMRLLKTTFAAALLGISAFASPASAQEAYIGEIRFFAGNYAPQGWAFCDGQLLTVSENPALYSILGVTYGGDGRTNFRLPDMRGRFPMHAGQGPGLRQQPLGYQSGSETTTLTVGEMPAHVHAFSYGIKRLNASEVGADGEEAAGVAVLTPSGEVASPIAIAGQSLPHNNMPPYVTVNCIIALQGLYPPRQ